MPACRLTEKVDLDILYDIEMARMSAERAALFGCTREAFHRVLTKFPSVGYEIDGRPVGGVFFDGRHPHIGVLPEYHGRWAPLWKPTLEWLFTLQDPMEARVELGNARCIRFLERNGWQPIAAGKYYITFLLTSKNHPWLVRGICKNPAARDESAD